jgi:5-(carboxyamino)imidazole ribonucleotide synthase
MRERLTALAVPAPRWAPVSSADDLDRFGAEVGWPVVVKATRGGYDGKGVLVVHSAAAAAGVLASGTPLIVEERVPLVRELAAVVARSPYGQVAAWPVVETVQRDGVCVEVLAPAPGLSAVRAVAAQQLAIRIATELDVVGVLAVELFETADGILVNELAMRPHNSGHWTIEGAETSQFENHLRAVLGLPLGSTAPRGESALVNLIGREPDAAEVLAVPGAHLHRYGKAARPGRKLGHVTVVAEDAASRDARLAQVSRLITASPGGG